MAFNNWDKLSKAQRDYPKPKFAVGVVDKALKKSPKNPFLLTWKVDLALQQNTDPSIVLERLAQVSLLPGLTDPRLLSYLYTLYVEAGRRSVPGALSISSVGVDLLKPWQNAAKALDRKSDRLELWDTLFNTAMREDCWEDVRFAVVNYNKEGAPSKKLAHYTLILTVQLAAEQKHAQSNHADQMAQIQYGLARKLMKQAYDASPEESIAVKDIRDLRFMADIYRRQDRCAELFALWDNPPLALQGLMKTYRDELLNMKTRMLRQQEDWPALESHCLSCIEDTISQLNLAQDSKSLWELCAWRWDLWGALLVATEAIRPGKEGADKVSSIMDQCFGAGFQAKDRPLRLTYMKLRLFTGIPMLSDCKEYWEYHSGLSTCFADLRPFVETLSDEDQKNFSRFILDRTRGIQAESSIEKAAFEQWQVVELNVLRFEYLLTISLHKMPAYAALENFIIKAIGACITCPKRPDSGILAVYALLHLHHQVICQEDGKVPFEVTPNSRILLQATMLARHLVALDKEKDNRTLCLLAARLHLNLGLGKCAFRLYNHAKCKEMLLDTLSPYILSRISMTHPFDVKGYQGFSADEELERVIGTIERMERKTDSFLFVDMSSFVWDQASDALKLKRKLKSSLTKHMCVTERRRIARLKGDSTENLPRLEFKTYNDISDNVDRSVFPNCESTGSAGPLAFVMPNGIPNVPWLFESHREWETPSRILYREGDWRDADPWRTKGTTHPNEVAASVANKTSAELHLTSLWKYIHIFTVETYHPGSARQEYAEDLQELFQDVHSIRKAMEKLRMPSSTTLKPEDEPTMFHENMLISCYTKLEAIRALNKLGEHIRDKVMNPKSTHPLKAQMPKNWLTDLTSETQICYEAIRDVAQSYITLIKKKGETAIKAQVRWGKTGEVLQNLLKDDDVDYYAREYVESALEAWNGVLKVKLK
ncbi:N-acetyltransferase B complex non catalytic subunit-domain-containing protein [Pyrenochaeta sp. MPI-SDFR-AT-0127]|nr:N-acetyltransferase B complex non catalytic subunit-domain-containing protein [Pyrenochaeta sp. MPI-SDFR-AT-0127]